MTLNLIESAGKKFRLPTPTAHLWSGKGRDVYVAVTKRMGFYDVCECDNAAKLPWRKRANSGIVGQMECKECGALRFPLSYVFDCDECCEPTLADKFPVPLSETFLCPDCD